MCRVALCLQLAMVLVFLGLDASSAQGRRRVMPWMCLERCGEDVTGDLQQISAHRHNLSAVAFEAYDVGPDGILINNGFSNVAPVLQQYGLRTFAMLTTVNLTRVRQLFTPRVGARLIAAAVKASVQRNLTGVNVDFECTGGDQQDSASFTIFIDAFAHAMHVAGMELTVCVGRELFVCPTHNSPWNFSALANTAADRVISMDTYASKPQVFSQGLDYALANIGQAKLGVGLSTYDLHSNVTFTVEQMKWRFNQLQEVEEVDIWQAPLPDFWWGLLQS